MSVTLCEQCFPNWGDHEVKTIVPLGGCAQCGRMDERRGGGLRCHLFARDPRLPARATLSFSVNPAGNLDVLAVYEGGFSPENPAHDIAATIAGNLGAFLDPLTAARDLTAEEVELVQAGNLAAVLAG